MTGFAVDLGGTKITAVAAEPGARVFRAGTPASGEAGDVLTRVADLVREACGGTPDGPGVVATPGAVEAGSGVVRAAANLPFRDYPLGPALAAELGVPVTVVVDTAAAATAEFLPGGAAAGCRIGAYVTISTGIGMAVVTNGTLHHGARSQAGELGHVPVEVGPGALGCPCGQRGCLEAYASGSGLARRASAPDAREVVRAARAGEDRPRRLLDDALARTSAALAGVIRVLDPEAVVLGGGLLVNAGLFGPLRQRVGDLLRVTVPDAERIVRLAAHGQLSPLLGAAALARNDAAAVRFARPEVIA